MKWIWDNYIQQYWNVFHHYYGTPNVGDLYDEHGVWKEWK